jgi:hypothetical protein
LITSLPFRQAFFLNLVFLVGVTILIPYGIGFKILGTYLSRSIPVWYTRKGIVGVVVGGSEGVLVLPIEIKISVDLPFFGYGNAVRFFCTTHS